MNIPTEEVIDHVNFFIRTNTDPELRFKYEYMLALKKNFYPRLVEMAEEGYAIALDMGYIREYARTFAKNYALAYAKGFAEGYFEGLRGTIEILLSLGIDHAQILSKIKECHNLTTAEADRYIEQVIKEISENIENSENSESNNPTQP